jgi:hypothetical protein
MNPQEAQAVKCHEAAGRLVARSARSGLCRHDQAGWVHWTWGSSDLGTFIV